MFCTSASYLVARFHKVSFMHPRDTGPLDNLGPFGPIVIFEILSMFSTQEYLGFYDKNVNVFLTLNTQY